MTIAVRGEGSSDIGFLDNDLFIKGPMIILLEKLQCYKKLLELLGFDDGFDINDFVTYSYITKHEIEPKEKIVALRGKKEPDLKNKKFYIKSKAFAQIAKTKEADIAIFFSDQDKDNFIDRYIPINAGLKSGGYDKRGIAMIPTRISEAWLLCCLDYLNCQKYESYTTDKDSPNYPKRLCDRSGKNRFEIAKECDPNQINMPSFNVFKKDFSEAINDYLGYQVCEV